MIPKSALNDRIEYRTLRAVEVVNSTDRYEITGSRSEAAQRRR